MEKYTIPSSADILGIENGRLREWVSREYVTPDYPAQGRGNKHKLTRDNLYQAKLFEYLIERGLARKQAAEIAKTYTKPDMIAGFIPAKSPVAEGKDFVCVYKEGDRLFHAWYSKGQFFKLDDQYDDVFIVNVGKLKTEVDRSIK